MGDLTEDEIARIIRDVENEGQYIHGMMPEAAARAIMVACSTRSREALIEDMLDALRRAESVLHIELSSDGETIDIVRAAIAKAEGQTAVTGSNDNAAANRNPLVEALEFYADNLIDGGSKARMALQLRATRKARRPDVVR